MFKRHSLIVAGCILLGSNLAYGDTAGGTGEPRIQLHITSDQRAILSLSEGQTLAIGSANLQQGYAELPLDVFSATSSQTDWGKAEVLFGCGVADVLVYQQRNGQWVEVLAEQLVTDTCIE